MVKKKTNKLLNTTPVFGDNKHTYISRMLELEMKTFNLNAMKRYIVRRKDLEPILLELIEKNEIYKVQKNNKDCTRQNSILKMRIDEITNIITGEYLNQYKCQLEEDIEKGKITDRDIDYFIKENLHLKIKKKEEKDLKPKKKKKGNHEKN